MRLPFFSNTKLTFAVMGVVAKKSVDEKTIVNAPEEITHRKEQLVNFDDKSNLEIIYYLLQRFHAIHRDQLVELQP